MILSFVDNKKNGIPVIFIHGTASANDVWENQYKALNEQNFRIIGIDLRGHGKSKNPGGICTIDVHVNDLKETFSHIGINEKMIIIGHSFGAVLALKFAESYPEEVIKLLLVSIPPKVPQILHRYYKWLLGKPIDILTKKLKVITKLPIKKRHKLALTSDISIVRQIWRDSVSWDFLSEPPKVLCPVHFSVGRFDYVAPKDSIHRLHRTIPNSSYKVFNFASHTCMEDQPKAFNEWVLSRLK